jgi:hypothetical protein
MERSDKTPVAVSGPVGRHTEHYLRVVDLFRNDHYRSYHYHHLMLNFQVVGPFDPVKFIAALHKLAELNPMLRSHFRKQPSGTWEQIVNPRPDPRMISHRRIGAEVTDWVAFARELVVAENEHPIAIDDGPLIRFTVLEFAATPVVVVKFHHIACDGWGIMVALNQLLGLYQAELAGVAAPIPPLTPAQMLAFATREAEELNSPDGRAGLKWWREYLAGHAFIRHPLPERPQGRLAVLSDRLSVETSNALAKLAERQGVHISYLGHAAFLKTLKMLTQSDDILVTFVKANRNEANSAVVGNFADWVMVRHRLDLTAPLPDIAQRAQTDVAVAKDHYQPYWHIVEEMALSQYFNDFGVTPYSFDFMPYIEPKLDMGGGVSFIPLYALEVLPFRLTATDLFCRMTIVGDSESTAQRVEIMLIYHGGYLDQAKVQRALDEMKRELEAAAKE